MADYYILNETLVDEDVAMKNRTILHENTYENNNGYKLFTLTFKQVLQSFGVRNWNGRIYSKDIVMNAIKTNPLVQHNLKMDTWVGEYGHPIIEKGMNELARQMTLFPPNCCWKISKVWEEGNLLMGECTTLAGGYGDIVRDRILTGMPSMASSRAIGGVDKNGNVLPGYSVITFDNVYSPSHKEAYMVKGSERTNEFPIRTSQKNTMAESAISINLNSDSFKSFLLAESTSKQQINTICEAFGIDANSMTITDRSVNLTRINEDGSLQKIVMPLNRLVNASYYNLFND